MKRIGSTMIVLAAALALAALPALAGNAVPRGGPGPIATASAARQVLRSRGLADIRHLWRIGDYWESEAQAGGRPVVAYLFDNGTLWLRHYPRAEMRQAFGGPVVTRRAGAESVLQ